MGVLVTGGAGYIGSHYLLYERARGTGACVVDSLVRGHRAAVGDAPLRVGDLRDRTFLDSVLEQETIDAVVHFAAFACVGESVKRPREYHDNNVRGTLTLLEAMRDHGIDKLVFSSSCSVYGAPGGVPIPENQRMEPISPYGHSKRACEDAIYESAEAWGLRFVILRYFNAAGADAGGRIGESHDPETHLIPNALRAALDGSTLHVLGADYDTDDGTCVRDYVHVEDVAEAHGKALDHLNADGASTVLNLGSERGTSVRQVVAVCERLSGRRIHTVEAPRRAGDPAVLVASTDAARATLGWTPRRSDLEHIVETARRWEQRRRF